MRKKILIEGDSDSDAVDDVVVRVGACRCLGQSANFFRIHRFNAWMIAVAAGVLHLMCNAYVTLTFDA